MLRFIEPLADGIHGVHFEPFGQARLVADQALELGAQRIRQGVGERRQQHPASRDGARQVHGPVQGDDGLARAGRAGNARRAVVVALHPLPLRRVQEDRPLLPRELQGALQFLHVGS
jgi:hypothetical protein